MPFLEGAKVVEINYSELNDVHGDFIDYGENRRRGRGSSSTDRTYFRFRGNGNAHRNNDPSSPYRTDPGPASSGGMRTDTSRTFSRQSTGRERSSFQHPSLHSGKHSNGPVSPSIFSGTSVIHYTGGNVNVGGGGSLPNINSSPNHNQPSSTSHSAAQAQAQASLHAQASFNPFSSTGHPESYTSREPRGSRTNTLDNQRMPTEGSLLQHNPEAEGSSCNLPLAAPEDLFNEALRDAPLKKKEGFLGF